MATVARLEHPVVLVRAGETAETEHLLGAEGKPLYFSGGPMSSSVRWPVSLCSPGFTLAPHRPPVR
jgi:hypothetical protein